MEQFWDLWSRWWSGQSIQDLSMFGLPIVVWGRIGKAMQYLGGLTVVAEIVGPERFRSFGDRLTGIPWRSWWERTVVMAAKWWFALLILGLVASLLGLPWEAYRTYTRVLMPTIWATDQPWGWPVFIALSLVVTVLAATSPTATPAERPRIVLGGILLGPMIVLLLGTLVIVALVLAALIILLALPVTRLLTFLLTRLRRAAVYSIAFVLTTAGFLLDLWAS
ncbi:hypothetical protein ABGB07_24080 [Micromonosporaceae bacterium B7E4]